MPLLASCENLDLLGRAGAYRLSLNH